MADQSIDVSVNGRDNLSPILKQLESGIIRFVGAVSSALTVISIIGFPIKAAAEFQQALLEVKKTTDFTADSMSVLKAGLLEVSKTTNVAQNELAKVAALGGQQGVGAQGPEALVAFTEELSRAITALDVSAEQAAPAMGKLVNIFNLPLDKFRNAVAVINQLSNVSTASAEEILDVMRRIGDVGGSVTFAQSAALSALAIDLGVSAETAGTSITKIFADMKSSAADFAAFMGTSTEEWVNQVNTDGITALTRFLDQLNRLPSEVASSAKVSLTGGGRIFELVTKLQNQLRLGDSSRMASLLREANDEWAVGTSAIKEQQNVLSGLIAQWDIFKNRVATAFIAAGDEALRSLTQTLDTLGQALSSPEFVTGLSGIIENLVKLAGAVAEFTTGVFSSLGESTVEWGTVFDIVGLLAVIGVLKTLPAIAKLALSSFAPAAGGAGLAAAATAQTGALQRLALASAAAAEARIAQADADALYQQRRGALNAVEGQLANTERQIATERARYTVEYGQLTLQITRQRVALNTEVAAAAARSGAIQQAWDQKLLQLQADRLVAQVALTQAIQAGDAAAVTAARKQISSIGRGFGGTNSAYTQSLQRERAASAVILQQMTQDYQKTITAIRNTRINSTVDLNLLGQTRERLVADREAISAEVAQLRTSITGANGLGGLGARLTAALDGPFRAIVGTFRTTFTALPRIVNLSMAEMILGVARGVGPMQRGLLALRNAVAAFAGIAPPATAQLGLMGNAAIFASAGVRVLAQAFGFLRVAIAGIFSLISRVFFAFLLLDLAKMALQAIGAWDELVAVFGRVLDRINEIVREVNDFVGFDLLPTIGPDKDAQRRADDIKREIAEREKLRAEVEKFDKRFGKVKVEITADPSAINKSVDDLSRRLVDLNKYIQQGVTLGGIGGVSPAQAFLEGTEAVSLMEVKLRGLIDRQRELSEVSAADLAANVEAVTRFNQLEARQQSGALNTEEQEELLRLTEQREGLLQRAAQRTEELRGIELQRLAIMEGQDAMAKSLLSSLDSSALTELFGGADAPAEGLIQRLVTAKQVMDSIGQAQRDLEQKLKTDQATPGETDTGLATQYAQVNTQLAIAKENFEFLRGEAGRTQAVIKLAGGDALKFVDAFAGARGASAALQSISNAAAQTQGGIRDLLKGLGSITNSIEGQNRLASNVVFGKLISDAYGKLATSARQAAEQANNAIAQALAKNKRDAQELLKFFQELDQTLAASRREADTQVADVKIDSGTDKKLFDLDEEKLKKKEILDLDLEDGRISEERHRRAMFQIEQEFSLKAQRIRDAATLQKAQNESEGARGAFFDAVADARAAQEELRKVNAALQDSGLTDTQKDGFINKQAEAAAGLEGSIDLAKKALGELASIGPVGGKLVVAEQDLLPLKTVLRELQESSGGLQIDGLTSVKTQLDSLASSLESGRKAWGDLVTVSVDGLKRIASESGASMDLVAQNIARVYSDPAILAQVKEFGDQFNRGLIDPTGIRFDAKQFEPVVKELQDKWAIAARATSLITPPLDETALNDQAKVILSQLQKLFSVPITALVPDTISAPDGTPPSLDTAVTVDKAQIQEALDANDYTITPKIVLDENNSATDGTGTTARGFASGGSVRGKGTSKSDSILAWLSNGEFVMDALTVRMFGPGFFSMLQSIAKGGVNLKSIMPGFAEGGLAATATYKPTQLMNAISPSITNIFASPVRNPDSEETAEEVVLNLTLNGNRASRLRGSRDSVNDFVDALYELGRA